MDLIAFETEKILRDGIPEGQMIWYSPVICPPNKLQTRDNQCIVELMLSAIFNEKFPKIDPKFYIFWDKTNKGYKIAIYSIASKISDEKIVHQEVENHCEIQVAEEPTPPQVSYP